MEKHNKVQENFGKNASNYRYSTVHNDPVDLDRMIELLNPKSEDKVLDVATGAGHTAIKLAGYTKKVVAIDITAEMLSEARKQSKEKDIDNIEFCVEDVHNMKFPDNKFDIVTSRLAAHHFSHIKKALEEMCRVLKPGGELYILDCSVADGDESERIYNKIELLRDSSHVCSYSPRLWNEMLKDLPLKVQKTNFYKLRYELPIWFDRMGTISKNRDEIFKILNNLSEKPQKEYSYSNDYITTYRIEILAQKI
ncbi:methyltransferase domain-containing protein [Clostridium tyrobutyricum]|uniref:class I SAM-dependent methyltransferase n=1 Tax=Clostridium tyrobutyricum TaxID=1519 RepID=UPI001C392EE8|nr:methyltransferase domain-containing protein [Clostridium tyrobutyricum]MBV4418967.1 methyltransferase domain-containing protein [Clostridium tyrobutyricum]